MCFHGVKSICLEGEVELLHFTLRCCITHKSGVISLHDIPLRENMNNFETGAMHSVAITVVR